jgi:hypothetical protein
MVAATLFCGLPINLRRNLQLVERATEPQGLELINGTGMLCG